MAKSIAKVLICSKLPTSLVLNHPLDPSTKVTVRGLNAATRGTNGQPIVVPYITTEIDVDFWQAWNSAHGLESRKPFPAIKSGAIWEAKTPEDAKSVAREKEKQTTGLQPMSRDIDERMGRNNVSPDKD